MKPSRPGNSSDSDSDKESTHSSISLTDDKYQKHPPRQSFISERKSFKVFKSNYYLCFKLYLLSIFINFFCLQIFQISNYGLFIKWLKHTCLTLLSWHGYMPNYT